MKMNILEKLKPVTPIKEEENGPEDVPGRNNYIPKSPKPAAAHSQYTKATLHDSIISGLGEHNSKVSAECV
jgi:hypothetical protein